MRQMYLEMREYARTSPLRITGRVFNSADAVYVRLTEGGISGQGEANGVFFFGETPDGMLKQLDAVRSAVENGASRTELYGLLPAGGARNALDAALWDLEAKQQGKSIWELTNITERDIYTVDTVSIAQPEKMAEDACKVAGKQIKLKLDAEMPVERVRAVHLARPDATIVVDVNQGWNFDQLVEFASQLADLGVAMIEQPLPRGKDSDLENYAPPVPICADESCLDSSDIETVSPRYQMINIKLDKTGGLTEAIRLTKLGRDHGLQLMVGNMSGSSLANAPGYVIAQLCDVIDMDGPLSMANDITPGFQYDAGLVKGYSPLLWG